MKLYRLTFLIAALGFVLGAFSSCEPEPDEKKQPDEKKEQPKEVAKVPEDCIFTEKYKVPIFQHIPLSPDNFVNGIDFPFTFKMVYKPAKNAYVFDRTETVRYLIGEWNYDNKEKLYRIKTRERTSGMQSTVLDKVKTYTQYDMMKIMLNHYLFERSTYANITPGCCSGTPPTINDQKVNFDLEKFKLFMKCYKSHHDAVKNDATKKGQANALRKFMLALVNERIRLIDDAVNNNRRLDYWQNADEDMQKVVLQMKDDQNYLKSLVEKTEKAGTITLP